MRELLFWLMVAAIAGLLAIGLNLEGGGAPRAYGGPSRIL